MSLIAGGRRGAEIPAAENCFQWKREKSMFEVMLKRLEQPDEIRTFEKGQIRACARGRNAAG
jgi:hypothetical protein